MTNNELEQFLGKSSYHLARKILDDHKEEGFYFHKEEDMVEVRKINSIANLLESLGDIRFHEIKIEVNSLIYFTPRIKLLVGKTK